MRIGVLAYNFEHKKTQEGLVNLFVHGYDVRCVLAADPVELRFYQSKIRIAPKGLHYIHPLKLAERFGYPYFVVGHNDATCAELVEELNLDLGIILGARILRKPLIESFRFGILNLHPGLIPLNRGLDNIKWAILKQIPMGVTAHLISEQIDFGPIISQQLVPIYEDDTILDLHLRLQDTEQLLMINAIDRLGDEGQSFAPPSAQGTYFKAVPVELEATLADQFIEYKRIFAVRDQKT